MGVEKPPGLSSTSVSGVGDCRRDLLTRKMAAQKLRSMKTSAEEGVEKVATLRMLGLMMSDFGGGMVLLRSEQKQIYGHGYAIL